MIAVYIILTHYGTYYTGMTNSIIRRWGQHVRGESSYLRRVKPKEVVYIEFWPNYSVAGRRERYIKRIGAGKFLIKLKYSR
jgi:putative endonuclease